MMGSKPSGRPDFKSRLRSGDHLRALFVGTLDATLCELVALLGWDMLIVDAEHGAMNARDMESIARACELRGAVAAARIPRSASYEIGRYLDAGAVGVMIPMVESPGQAEGIVELVKYPPRGRRGAAAPRCAGFGLANDAAAEFARANDETVLIMQIETIRGVEQADAIAEVEGVDALFVGPTDLSLALGTPLSWDSASLASGIGRVSAAARRNGKAFGIYAGDVDRTNWCRSMGASLIGAALEDLIILGSRQLKE